MFIQAKRAKAAEYGSSISDRGEEMSKERESSEVQQKTKLEEKLEAAMQRKAELQAKSDKKKEIAEARRQRARELGRQRKLERANISNWEDESLSPSAGADGEIDELQDVDIDIDGWQDKMEEDELGEMQGTGSTAGGSYEEKRLQAKQQLMNEIQLANEAKRDEFIRITKEMKTSKKPRAVHQREPSMASSIQSFGSIDNNEQLSFDECDVSISGLSKVHEEQTNVDRRKAQTALALAELDIKLSEIQLMQSILLAEEASLSGMNEFKTTDQSVDDLSKAKGAEQLMQKRRSNERKNMLKNRAKHFFAMTMTQAKVPKQKAGKTIEQVRLNLEKRERIYRSNGRPSTAPSASVIC